MGLPTFLFGFREPVDKTLDFFAQALR